MSRLEIDIWSDIACPWCFVGKRRFESALSQFPHRESVQVRWRAFELDQAATEAAPGDRSYATRLAEKYGTGLSNAQGMIDRMVEVGKSEGINFDFQIIRPGNTFNAHRLLHFAWKMGKQDALNERFLDGCFSRGIAIGQVGALIDMSAEAGLDPTECATVLTSGAFAEEVREDEREAVRLGVRGVPFFVIGGYAISGAQPQDAFQRTLSLAWSERAQSDVSPAEEGEICGPHGCDEP